MSTENRSHISLSELTSRGNIFQEVRLLNIIMSLINKTGITDRHPAIIPIPNLRDPRGELSRYEKIYPQIRIGRNVNIIMGIRENSSIFI